MHGVGASSYSGWIVARTKSLQESKAEINIKRQGYSAVLLRCEDEDTGRISPLFPGYIFVFAPDRWQWLCSTYGILDVVLGSGGAPAQLPLGQMEELQRRTNVRGYVPVSRHKFAVGQRVRITEGSFWDRVGLYQATAQDRIFILLELLGRTVKVTVPERFVEVA